MLCLAIQSIKPSQRVYEIAMVKKSQNEMNITHGYSI